MVNIDGSVLFQIINFVMLIIILNMLVYKPIRNILSQRKEKVAGLEDLIERSENDVIAKDDAFKDGLKKAREKGLGEKNSLIQQASDEEKVLISKINEKAQADLAQIREKIAQDADDVRKALKREVGAYAEAIGQKILGRTVS